jgi:hypothetical protein
LFPQPASDPDTATINSSAAMRAKIEFINFSAINSNRY